MSNETGLFLTLQEKDDLVEQEAYEQGTRVAQIFSGIFFSGLTAWLSVSNGNKMAYVQKAALEKRLTVCCFLNVYVSAFSAFFNIFQLTEVDNLLLPETEENFTLDLARPIEWMLTCPLMQLALVLMGGAKLPEYRRFMMPGFSLGILSLGFSAAMFAPNLALKLCLYCAGCVAFVVMAYFNRLQIIEYSGGEEGLLSGDSEFRKATVLLLLTWCPFPTWFIMSPEGFGIINNVLLIQVGWAFLNIVAKFSFIFYMQRIKDMYCNRLKTKREMQGVHKMTFGSMPGGMSPMPMFRPGNVSPPAEGAEYGADYLANQAEAYEMAEADKKKAQLSAVVVETMNFLGMAQHTDRFLKLLDNAQVANIFEVEALTKEQCDTLSLPWDLVTALQRRLRVWKLEMVDDAEMGLDKGEEFYIRKGVDMPKGLEGGAMPGMVPYGYPGMPGWDGNEDYTNAKVINTVVIEELLQKTENTILESHNSKGQLWEDGLSGLAGQFQTAMEALEQRMCSKLDKQNDVHSRSAEQLGNQTSASSRSELRAFETRVTAKLDEMEVAADKSRRHLINSLETRLTQNMDQQVSLLTNKVDVVCQKLENVVQKVEVCHTEQQLKTGDVGAKVTEKLDELFKHLQANIKNFDSSLTQLGGKQDDNLKTVLEQISDSVDQSRSGFEAVIQKTEVIQAHQTKQFASAEDGWRQKMSELETNMVCREDETEASAKRRHEELVRLAPTRKLDDLSLLVQKVGDRSEQAVESITNSVLAELQAATGRVNSKTEGLVAGVARQQAESGEHLQGRLEETVVKVTQRVEALETFIDKRAGRVEEVAQQGSTQVAQRMDTLDSSMQKKIDQAADTTRQEVSQIAARSEQAIETLDHGLHKRIDTAMARVFAEGAHTGSSHTDHRAEKAIEALETVQRGEMHSMSNSILERVEDIQVTQARKSTEREERNMRRLEEVLELNTSRGAQKTEDVGLEIKKELHGFAKRLNSKIPFM